MDDKYNKFGKKPIASKEAKKNINNKKSPLGEENPKLSESDKMQIKAILSEMQTRAIKIRVEMSSSGEITKLVKLDEGERAVSIKSPLIKEDIEDGLIILEKKEEEEVAEGIYDKLIENIKIFKEDKSDDYTGLFNEIKGFKNTNLYNILFEEMKANFGNNEKCRKIFNGIKDFKDENLYTKLLEYIRISGDPKMKIEFVLDADIDQKRKITCLLNCASDGRDGRGGMDGFQLEFKGFEIVDEKNNIKNIPLRSYNYENTTDTIKSLYNSLGEIQKNNLQSIYVDSVIFMLAEAARSEPCREAANKMYMSGLKGIENTETIEGINGELQYIKGYMKCYKFIRGEEETANTKAGTAVVLTNEDYKLHEEFVGIIAQTESQLQKLKNINAKKAEKLKNIKNNFIDLIETISKYNYYEKNKKRLEPENIIIVKKKQQIEENIAVTKKEILKYESKLKKLFEQDYKDKKFVSVLEAFYNKFADHIGVDLNEILNSKGRGM